MDGHGYGKVISDGYKLLAWIVAIVGLIVGGAIGAFIVWLISGR